MTPSAGSHDDDAPKRDRRARRRIAYAPEWEILVFGVLLGLFFVFVLRVIYDFSQPLFGNILSTTVVFFLSGRAGGLLEGQRNGLPPWLVIGIVMYLETFVVTVVFPLFVLSFEELITFRPLLRAAARVRRIATTHHDKVVKYGIPGLFFFVWFPFWMTGPLVGSVIGYCMGLRHTVNLTVVLLGTYVAIFSWATVLRPLYERLEKIGPAAPIIAVGALVALGVLGYARRVLRRRKQTPPEDKSGGA